MWHWAVRWRPKPFHPNAAGMRVVAELIVARFLQP
jgi:hypothetical protein